MFPKDGNKPSTEDVDYLDTWKAMEKLFHSGKAKAIGICNFSKTETERILKEGEVVSNLHICNIVLNLNCQDSCSPSARMPSLASAE
jgi:diketogulonate reductase-like aldo/keto reductase